MRGPSEHPWTSAGPAWDRLVVVSLRVLLSVLAAWLLTSALVEPAIALADTEPGPAALASGRAAQAQRPPDVAAARAAFEIAAASSDDRAGAEALFLLGELDEGAMQFQSALARYQASASRLPSSRYAPRANARAADLRSHGEGDFAPLARLETVRRSPELANSAAGVDTLVRDADAFPPGRVRVEARMLGAEAYLGRLHRPDQAIPLLELVAEDPKADVLMARQAASDAVATEVGRGDLDVALEMARKYRRLVEPTTERSILRQKRRAPLRAVASANLVVVIVAGLLGVIQAGRRRVFSAVARLAPLALLFLGFAMLVGGLLASTYESSSPLPFAALLLPTFGVALAARAWSANGSRSTGARAFRAVACFGSVFAVAFLTLDRMDPMYLSGFGL